MARRTDHFAWLSDASAREGLPGMTKRYALSHVGGSIGGASKMPCGTYGISARKCKVGGKLAQVPGSVCEDCYALKANYIYPSVALAHARRLASLTDPEWATCMAWLIERERWTWQDPSVFRWHDSGDLQDLAHLENIVQVAMLCPEVMFWLPTKEYGIVREWRTRFGMFPRNLVVRVSAPMVDRPAPASVLALGQPVSLVHTRQHGVAEGAIECYAMSSGTHACGDCRVCWDSTQTPSYMAH